jgi:hypothetical protein
MNEKMKTAATAPTPTRADEIFFEMKTAQAAAEMQALRDQAEAQAEAEAKDVVRLAAHETIRRRVREELDGKDLEAAREKLELALDAFVEVCRKHDDRFSEIFYPLNYDSSLLPWPDDIQQYGMDRPFVAGLEPRQASCQGGISLAARAAIMKYYPRQGIDLNSAAD